MCEVCYPAFHVVAVHDDMKYCRWMKESVLSLKMVLSGVRGPCSCSSVTTAGIKLLTYTTFYLGGLYSVVMY